MLSRNKKLEESFLAQITEVLKLHDFKYLRTYHEFIRKFDGGEDQFSATFSQYFDGIGILPYLGIRHNTITSLVMEFSPSFPLRLRKHTSTLGNTMINVCPSRNLVWSITDETQVASVRDEVMRECQYVALPYYARFSSLEEVLKVFLNEEPRVHILAEVPAAKTAIAVAFILRRREAFDYLVERETKRLLNLSYQHPDRNEFFEMVAALRSRW